MAGLHEYECPNCGGAMEFNVKLQKLSCPYCDSSFTENEFEELLKNKQNKAKDKAPEETGEKDANNDRLLVYICKSCGGQIIGNDDMGATSCPYCGNNVIVTEKFEGEFKPDLAIPFKIEKKAAKAALYKHFEKKLLLPKAFKTDALLDEIKGVYVPFWLFDTTVAGDATYDCRTVRTWSDSKYDYSETKYYTARRSGEMDYEKVPADASSKMANDMMDSIEPFDYSELSPYKSAYLAGFYAEKYDEDAKTVFPRIEKRTGNTLVTKLRGDVTGYTSVFEKTHEYRTISSNASYALLPVWLLTCRWDDKVYTFAMNGQTGKFVGNLPMDKKKYAGLFAGIMATVGLIASFILLWI